ncbi:MAG: hypothetical protein HZC24_02280 [Rhodocyclales bacterium]|nr:hypothetical protein [Rhodocyclales bacterium]
MDRLAESSLLDFCVKQREAFSAEKWRDFDSVSKRELAATALFLAGSGWYGHRSELLDVAHLLLPTKKESFGSLSRDVNMDCSRFSSMLKARIRRAPRIP